MVKIKKITQLSHSGIRPLNEDKVLVDEQAGVFGVFDGASSLDSYLSPDGKTGAYIASNIAADTFMGAEESLEKTALLANKNIEDIHKKAGVDVTKSASRFATTVAVIRINEDEVELLQMGDSIVLVVYKDGRVDVPLGYHDHDVDIMRLWRQLADEGRTNIRDIVADDVIKLRESANIAYGSLNGDEKVKNFLKTTTINAQDIATIIILTDGMYIPKTDPESVEPWDYYAQLYQEGGLDKIYNTVREIENSDPDLIKYPRYKIHDDASAVAIEFA
ncbi:MAG: protein phosphatase 2C domain-containing protein [Patescibacteria group bacterium]